MSTLLRRTTSTHRNRRPHGLRNLVIALVTLLIADVAIALASMAGV